MSGTQKFVNSVGSGIRKTGRFVKATTDTTADLLELTLVAASLTGRLLGKLNLLKKVAKAKGHDAKPSSHQGYLADYPTPENLIRVKEYERHEQPRQSIDEITDEKNGRDNLIASKPIYNQPETYQTLPSEKETPPSPEEASERCHGESYEPEIMPDCETEITTSKNAIVEPDNDSLQEIISAILEAQKTEIASQGQQDNENAIENITEETIDPYETNISAPSETEPSPEQNGWASGIDDASGESADSSDGSSDSAGGQGDAGGSGSSEGGDAE
jgi:hypothetical protein